MKHLVAILPAVMTLLAAGAAHAERVITVQPSASGVLCPTHNGQGDRDFYGNGPGVEASATLIVDRDRRRLLARLSMWAQETTPDYTTAEGVQDFVVWTAPEGMTLLGVEGSNRAWISYTDTDHAQDVLPGSGPVRRFQLTGDTSGDDLDGRCTNRRTSVQVLFNRVRLRVEDEAAGCPRRLVQAHLRNPGMFCPTWHVMGDGDFGGNGPLAGAGAELEIGSDDRTLEMSLRFNARENPWTNRECHRNHLFYWCPPPGDEVRGSHGGIPVWTAPEGCRIHEIRTGTVSSATYFDDDHSLDVLLARQGTGGFVHSFYLMGDRDGRDIEADPMACSPGEQYSAGVRAFYPVTVLVGP